MMRHRHPLLLSVFATVALAACQRDEVPEPPPMAPEPEATVSTAWPDFVDGYIEAHLAAHPAWAVVQGRHEYDGQLPDWSREGIGREVARLKAARETALAFPEDELTEVQRFQRDYVVARIDHDLFWIEKARWPFRNPEYYLGWLSDSLDPSPYITLNYAPPEDRMRAFVRYLEAIPAAAEQIRANLALPMPRTWVELGIDAFGGYAAYFRDDVPGVWAGVDDAGLQRAFDEANEGAIDAMEGLAAWLTANIDTATDDFALGEDLYRAMLWDTERVDTPLDELWAVGWADLRRNQAALREVCDGFAPGEDVRDCFARMADNKPADGVVIAARDQLEETRAFVEAQDLVSIPGTEEALVDEAPPYARSNFAYINIPGPWEENQPSTYYIAPPNPEWPEEVQAAYVPGEADLMGTSIHEVWPGHFLNFLHANRSDFMFGRAFVGYAFAEGWAHYTEEMMTDAGFRAGDPEARIGQLSNALLRNARFIASMGLHTRGWSVEQAKEFFMQEGFQDEGNSMQQAARGTYDPAYLNYNMAKLLIMRLREDWTATRGGREAWKDFHDAFLSYGGPPIPLVRMAMMGEPEPRALFPKFLDPWKEGGAAAVVRKDTFAFACDDGRQLVLNRTEGEWWLFLPGRTVPLEPDRAASGARYEGEGVTFWTKGDEAMLETEGDETTTCVIDAEVTQFEDAKLRGYDFLGLGNEPGWVLELSGSFESTLVTDDGQKTIPFKVTALNNLEGAEGAVFTGQAADGELTVTLRPGPCRDTVADREYETHVAIEYGDLELQGCGRALH